MTNFSPESELNGENPDKSVLETSHLKNYEKEEPSPKSKKTGSFFVEMIKIVFWATLIIIPIRTFLFQPFFVQGASMEPNFHDGEYLIINELGYKQTNIANLFSVGSFKEMKRTDIVVFRYPKDPSQYFIKRIIGMPEEKVEIKDDKIVIYNKENPTGMVLKEEYIPQSTRTQGDQVFNLKADEYLVLGDNRSHSSDSRLWGPVPEKNIIGKVLVRAWPVNKFNLFQ